MRIEGDRRLLGQVIGEFQKEEGADGVYGNRLRGLMIVKGIYPAKGGWELMVLTDVGSTRSISLSEVERQNGRYLIGAPRIIMHEAGLDVEEDQEGDDF